MKLTLENVVFFAPDLDKAIEHYRMIFGDPVAQRPGWAQFSKDGFNVALHRGKGGAARMDYVTPDLEDVQAAWVAAGLRVGDIDEKRGVRAFQGKGPDGNTFLVKEQLGL
jgi:hypothetical protein